MYNLAGEYAECSDFSEVDQGEAAISNILTEDKNTYEPLQNVCEHLVGLNDDTAASRVASFTFKLREINKLSGHEMHAKNSEEVRHNVGSGSSFSDQSDAVPLFQ